jgi:predicted DNA-binding ribbon-helix-helix protein
VKIGRFNHHPGIEKFFDILEEVKKEEQTTIETLLAQI